MKSFNQFVNNGKYTNINNIIDGYKLDYYQVPFSLGEGDGTCISDDEDYLVCFGSNFVYDYISDKDIEKHINDDLSYIDITKDWTNSIEGYETSYSNKNRHVLRISKISQEIKNGEKITPVIMQFDGMSYNYNIKNHIEDGNHRIRALQYLGFEYFPAFISGSHANFLIKYLESNYI